MTDGEPRPARVLIVVVTFLLMSTLASVLLAHAQGWLGLDPGVLTLTQLSTAVGALAAWLVWRRRLPRPAVTRSGLRRPAVVAVIGTAVLAAFLAVRAVLDAGWPVLVPASLGAPFGVVVLAQLVGAAGEEVGWRGVVQPALETRLDVLPAALVTGLLFGVGHVGAAASGPGVFVVFLLAATALSVALGYLTAGRSVLDRVALATGLHWLVNVTTLVTFSDGDESLTWTAANAVAAGLAAVVCKVSLQSPGRLGG